MKTRPRVMVLDGGYRHSLAVGAELKRVLGATILAVAASPHSPALRSRHTDVSLIAPHPSESSFARTLLQHAQEQLPDIIVPVGHASFARLISLSHSLPRSVRVLIPDAKNFQVASNKVLTYELARTLGIRVPREYKQRELTANDGQPFVQYPIFAKARLERGGPSTALLMSEAEYVAFDRSAIGGDVIFQEYIGGDSYTFAQNGYYEDGHPILSFQHVELLSVPRRGGSGTRVQTADLPTVRKLANRLLAALNWTGVAQVEFKRASNGEFVLMEINPKFWASYALSSRSGHPIAATAVARALCIDQPRSRRGRPKMSMVFPIRELSYALKNRHDQNIFASMGSQIWPPAHLDIELRDIWAYLPSRRTKAQPSL